MRDEKGRFIAGNKAGVGYGRPGLSEGLHIGQLKKTEIIKCLTRYLIMPIEELREVYKDKTLPAIDIWVITLIIKGIKGGDYKRLGFVLDRLIGKVDERITHDIDGNLHDVVLARIESIKKIKGNSGA